MVLIGGQQKMQQQQLFYLGTVLCFTLLVPTGLSRSLGQTDIGTMIPPSQTDAANNPATSVTLADTAANGELPVQAPPRPSATGSYRQPPTIPVAEGTVAQVAASGVPDRCIVAGSALFSSCAREIAAAQNRFNLTVDVLAPQNYTQLLSERGVTRDLAIQALREILADPSDSCCNESCTFNQKLLCDCEPTVLDVAVRFAGADVAFYALLIEHLAAGCGNKLYFSQTCPDNRTVALIANGMGESDGAHSAVPGACEAESASAEIKETAENIPGAAAAAQLPMESRGVSGADTAGQDAVQSPVGSELQTSAGN